MNVVKRRWPDLLIGLLVLLLLAGFAALLLGKSPLTTGGSSASQGTAQSGTAQTGGSGTTAAGSAASGTAASPQGSADPNAIPTIPASPGANGSGATTGTQTTPTEEAPPPSTSTATGVVPRTGGAVTTSEARTPTRNDYRISLGTYTDQAAVQAATAGVSKLGYTVYPIAVASGVVAQVGPFATREAATEALGDIQRALPGALLYPPRNAPASDSSTSSGSTPSSATTSAGTTSAATTPAAAPSGPVYLQVGAFRSAKAAQTAVSRVRDLGLEPSVNAPEGKLVTVVVGPFQGQALVNAEAKLQANGIDSFRVR